MSLILFHYFYVQPIRKRAVSAWFAFYYSLIGTLFVYSIAEGICFCCTRTLVFRTRVRFCLLKVKARTIFIDTREIWRDSPFSLLLHTLCVFVFLSPHSWICKHRCPLSASTIERSTEIDGRGICTYALKRENSIWHFWQ